MEQLKHRIAIHYEVIELDRILDFYSTILGFDIIRDICMAGGTGDRWAAVAMSDNPGVQLHFHYPNPGVEKNGPMKLEFSVEDINALAVNLRAHNIHFEWANSPVDSIVLIDLIGNELSFTYSPELHSKVSFNKVPQND